MFQPQNSEDLSGHCTIEVTVLKAIADRYKDSGNTRRKTDSVLYVNVLRKVSSRHCRVCTVGLQLQHLPRWEFVSWTRHQAFALWSSSKTTGRSAMRSKRTVEDKKGDERLGRTYVHSQSTHTVRSAWLANWSMKPLTPRVLLLWVASVVGIP